MDPPASSQRKHRGPYDSKEEDSDRKTECNDAHPTLLKSARRICEEEYCREQNSIREVLTGQRAGLARFIETVCCLGVGVCGFARPWCLIELGDKRMRIRIWIFEGDRKSTRLNSSHRCISYAV